MNNVAYEEYIICSGKKEIALASCENEEKARNNIIKFEEEDKRTNHYVENNYHIYKVNGCIEFGDSIHKYHNIQKIY